MSCDNTVLRRFRLVLAALALLLAAGVSGAGCESESGTTLPTGGAGSGAGGSHGGGGNGGSGGIFSSHGQVIALAVEPPAAVIDVVNGQASPATFAAIATFEDQFQAPVSASWTFDRLDLALVDASTGTVTAHGTLGGQGTLTASYADLSATADVSVKLLVDDNAAGLSPSEIDAFNTPDSQPSGTLLYPYDQTVFARDILAPELMWSGGGASDVYLVHLSDSFFEAKIYTTAPPPSRYLMSGSLWTQLTKSNSGGSVQLRIYRMSGGQAHAAMEQHWTIAQGSLRGTIYYWAVNTGQSMKIAPGSDAPTVVFDSGPYDQLGTPAPAGYDNTTPPWTQGVNNKRCVACHTVSKNGERLAGVFENKGSAPSPWGTVDISSDPAQILQISPYTNQTLFVALSPDGSYAVHNDVSFTLHLTDAATGNPIASALDGYTQVADPAFSPDGTLLAFSSNTVGSYPVEFWQANLDVASFDAQTQTFSNRHQVIASGGQTIAFPSFSPDSKWVFYQKGDYSRAKYGGNQVGHDDLYVADLAGQVGEIALDNANGVGIVDSSNLHLSYQPRANPIAVGGYFWVVFFSPRDYGNRMVSNGNPTYDNRKQLWVAAVDINPTPGTDPSHPPFYLRGQDPATVNMEGYWTLAPCKQEGNACDAGFECCTGFCQPDGNGGFACSPPGGCAQIGEACQSASDCCDFPEVECIGGFCALKQPN